MIRKVVKFVLVLLALYVVIMALLALPAVAQDLSDPHTGKADHNQTTNPPPPTNKAKAESSGRQPQTDQSNYSSSLNSTLVTVFTGVLAILAILQFWAMYRQAGYMRDGLHIAVDNATAAKMSAAAAKSAAQTATDTLDAVRQQTVTAKDAAKAALANARAAKLTAETVINSERAWMLFTEFFSCPSNCGYPTQISFTFKNCGRTPAWVTELKWQFTKSRSVLRVPFNYDVDSFTRSAHTAHHEAVIAADAPMTQETAVLDGGNPVTNDEEQDIVAGYLAVHFFGILRYRDIFDKQRTTTFCFTWNLNTSKHWQLSGPPEANHCD